MPESYDGHPQQAGINAPIDSPGYALAGLVVGLVVDRCGVDEPGNRRRNSVEYRVRDVHTGQFYEGVQALDRLHGMSNGEEVVYHATTRGLDGVALSPGARAVDTDGDLVLVGFVGGSRDRAVILGALPHMRSSYGARRGEGDVRRLVHNDVSVEINDGGTVTVSRGKMTMVWEVQDEDTTTVKFRGGSGAVFNLDIQPREHGPAVLLGADASQASVRGDSHRQTYNALVAVVNKLARDFYSHVHLLAAVPTTQPATVPSPTAPSGIGTAIPSVEASEMPESDLSPQVVVP